MNELLLHSKEIYERALIDFKPSATVLMLSGGDDSLTTYYVAKELGIKIDFVIHGNTRTGIPETTDFVRDMVKSDNYLEADAGTSYIDYVLRKGFFGSGFSAHAFTYHILKQDHFEKTVSHNLRKRKRDFRIMFLNGARRKESVNRMVTMKSPYKITTRRPNDMWVNLINEWEKHECLDYLVGNGIKRNPVAINLCRSGECMCGTMQSKGDRAEAKFFYPEWGLQLDELEREAIKRHGFGWGVSKPKQRDIRQGDLFQPMCVGCTKNVEITL